MSENPSFLRDGTRYQINQQGQHHREDGPAIEWPDGTKFWYRDGNLHREDGPASEYANGAKEWWYKGIFVGFGDKPNPALWARLTSVDLNGGPLLNGCIVDLDGVEPWFKDDLRHREDGPAICYGVRVKQWHLRGEYLGYGAVGFWELWDRLTDEQRANPNLLHWMPRCRI